MSEKSKLPLLFVLSAILIVSAIFIQVQTRFESQASSGSYLTESVDLSPGWNFISFTIDPQLTFKEFCSQIPLELDLHIYEYINGYQGGNCSSPTSLPELEIAAYKGYFIYSASNYSLSVTGKIAPPIFTLDSDTLGIGVPLKDDKPTYARDLCGKVGRDQREVLIISRWLNGHWDQHLCSLPPHLNNYQIEKNVGYFIQSSLILKPSVRPLTLPPQVKK